MNKSITQTESFDWSDSCGFPGKIQLKSSQTHLNKFERGNFDVFFVEVYNIGELRHIRYFVDCFSKKNRTFDLLIITCDVHRFSIFKLYIFK